MRAYLQDLRQHALSMPDTRNPARILPTMAPVDPLVGPLRPPYLVLSPRVISPTYVTLTFQQDVGFFWKLA